MKAWKHLIPILFPVILIVLLGIGAIVLPDHTFSTAEMRYLRQFPSWSWEKAVTGEYSIQMEEYCSDQFPLRDFWIYIAQRLLPASS